jgi:hypothetical protein
MLELKLNLLQCELVTRLVDVLRHLIHECPREEHVVVGQVESVPDRANSERDVKRRFLPEHLRNPITSTALIYRS